MRKLPCWKVHLRDRPYSVESGNLASLDSDAPNHFRKTSQKPLYSQKLVAGRGRFLRFLGKLWLLKSFVKRNLQTLCSKTEKEKATKTNRSQTRNLKLLPRYLCGRSPNKETVVRNDKLASFFTIEGLSHLCKCIMGCISMFAKGVITGE